MKIAILQLNPIVGDIEHNASCIEVAVRRATSAGAELYVTPELSLVGYTPRDLLLDSGFIARTTDVLADLAANLKGLAPTLVGAPEVNDGPGRPLFNSTMLLRGGRVAERFRKSLLPTYDVFDEDRYFEPGAGIGTVTISGSNVAVSVCEDVWREEVNRYQHDPLAALQGQWLDCFVNVSASPFVTGKQQVRERLLSGIARRLQTPVVYVNQVGGNDDLVFDGRSVTFDARGQLTARALGFSEETFIVDPSEAGSYISRELSEEEELWKALVLGTRNYAQKCGFKRAILGLSGGIDSALVAAVACEALGAANVEGVLMPSPWTSRASVADALALASRLGMRTRILPIAPVMENVQERMRDMMLMALATKLGVLLLTTDSKTGGLAVIADVPKTLVFRLSNWLNTKRRAIPQAIIDKAPSAEFTHRQAAPGLTVTDRAFGAGWRMPVARRVA